MSNTVAVFASARANGNTKKLIEWISNELGTHVIDLSEKNISPYDYEHKNLNDDFIPVINEILQYENIIFATPIYWYAASAQMKVFIDRTTDLLDLEELKDIGRQLRTKTSYIACTSASNEADSAFLTTSKNTFTYLGMDYGGHIHANCAQGFMADEYKNDVAKFIQQVKY
jgi:multimeric flavodoxin WrbA